MDNIEPMQVDEEGGLSHTEFNIENPNFDLEAYSNSFKGLARVRRLMFVARHCSTLAADALKYVNCI